MCTVKIVGIGIADTQIESIFDKFQRIGEQVEGNGVGLYMVKTPWNLQVDILWSLKERALRIKLTLQEIPGEKPDPACPDQKWPIFRALGHQYTIIGANAIKR